MWVLLRDVGKDKETHVLTVDLWRLHGKDSISKRSASNIMSCTNGAGLVVSCTPRKHSPHHYIATTSLTLLKCFSAHHSGKEWLFESIPKQSGLSWIIRLLHEWAEVLVFLIKRSRSIHSCKGTQRVTKEILISMSYLKYLLMPAPPPPWSIGTLHKISVILWQRGRGQV